MRNKLLTINPDYLKIGLLFIIWKSILLIVLFLSIRFIPLGYTDRFLGGGPILFHVAPELFSWANFDGEHYLSISIFGYKYLEQAFFPTFPFLISLFAKPFSSDFVSLLVNSVVAGLMISNISFLLSLIVLYKLITLDYHKKIAFLTIIIILVFPASFYFGSLYNESLFLLLSLLSFYSARKGKWFLASIFGIIASATRVFGFLLLPALLLEVLNKKAEFKKWFWILFIPLGLASYMFYQHINFGDPLAFYNLQTVVGEQHQRGIILLPQVYYRYIKMLLTVDMTNPIYQTIVLEFFIGILFLILPIIGFFQKVRFSYLFYALVGFLMPTVQGSFSSIPRYVIIFFPSFLILSLLLVKINIILRGIIITLLSVFLIIEAMLFFRGYWVA